MTTWGVTKGDLGDKKLIKLSGNGSGDLDTATNVTGKVKYGSLGYSLTGVVYDSANRVVEIDTTTLCGASDCYDSSLGNPNTLWKFTVVVTFGDGSKLTWPEEVEQSDYIAVKDLLG